jgi:uncharacterized iron-regulated membrane protein
MSLKRLVRQIHLWLGLLSGLVVFIVGITGAVYCFEKELRTVIHKELYTVQPGAQRSKALSGLIETVKNDYPKQVIKNIRVPGDPSASIEVNLKNKITVFAHPGTHRILGTLDMETEFFAVILKIHRSLYLGDPGKIITGTSALIFLVMLISGIILWWPANKRALNQKLSIKKNATKKRRNFDLHSVLGFYASWILIFSVLTGLIFAFKWAEKTMYWLSGSKKTELKPKSVYMNNAGPSPVDSIFVTLRSEYPGKDYFLILPEDSLACYRAIVVREDENFFKKQDLLFFDRYSGQQVKKLRYEDTSTGERLRVNNYNIHTGKVFGLAGQFLVFFAALIAASLPVTGFILWWNKGKKQERLLSEEFGI